MSVWVLLSDLGDEKGSHTRSGTSSEGVGNLESLKAITTFSFFPDNIEDGVNKFSTFSVMALSPVITSTSLSEDKVVWSEELTEGAGSD